MVGQLIGLSGYARSGKNAAAEVLVDEFGLTQVAWADKLRDVAYAINPLVSIEFSNFGGEVFHFDSMIARRLQDVINEFGWDGYKETTFEPEIRGLLQRLGTEAGRNLLGQNVWVDATLDGLADGADVVITDCRFPNEAQAIVDRGGEVWRINRPGVGPVNDHPSEVSLDDWEFDRVIENDGNLLLLAHKVYVAYDNLLQNQ